ncbi:MAG TPA: saccharopine dehydrogenase NADP-binding domain-containing protein [Kofleriaceae bacterium]|nr:saccharopine dehydrogenase NADP-binding domain-containing protein [Kofleriaceae bacterium]
MSARAKPTIVVYGASGVVGGLVAGALAAGGANVVLAGRDRPRLAAVRDRIGGAATVAVAAAHDRGALDRVVAGARVVVGCAGPYPQVGGALAAAAVAAGADYVDVASDQSFVRAMHEEHDADARRRGVIVAPGAGGLGAIGDWAARWAAESVLGAAPSRTRLGDEAPLDEITVSVAVDGFVPAPAARRAMIDAVSARGVVWRAARWDATRPAVRGRDVDFGALGRRQARSFPAPEIITLPRHVAARIVDGFIALPDDPWARGLERLAPLAGLASPFAGLLAPILETFVDPTQVPDAEARAAARFAVVADARRGFEQARVRVAGHDVYALAAVTVAEAALTLAARADDDRDAPRAGVCAPSELALAGATLTELEAAGALELTTSFSRPARHESVLETPDVRSS